MFKISKALDEKIDGYKKLMVAIQRYAPRTGEGKIQAQFMKCHDTLENFIGKVLK